MYERGRGRVDQWLRGALWLSLGCGAASIPAAAHQPPLPSAVFQVSQAAADPQRGRLLYDTYCIACHTTQAHWRDQHIVRSWEDLLYQVTRMQANAGQHWEVGEIVDVAVYLNDLFYHLPCPATGCRGPEARIGSPQAVLGEH